MYIINTTFQVDNDVQKEFLHDIGEEFLSFVQGNSSLHSAILSRVSLHPSQGTPGTEAFALQMRAPSAEARDEYMEQLLPNLLADFGRRFGQKVMYFTTVLDIVKG